MAAIRTTKPFDLQSFLETRTIAVNAALDRFLPPGKTKPATIHAARSEERRVGKECA